MYLKYTLGKGIIRPLGSKVQALQLCPTPSSKKLELAGYYCHFIPEFFSIVAPLSDPLKNESCKRIQWTTACEKAFQTLQTRLSQEPVLYSPDFTREFLLQTDASDIGLRAVLWQVVGGDEHPILCISKKLFLREKAYSVIEKEPLAEKWAMDSLHYYLLGTHFTLVTDHTPLRWLHAMKDTNPRIMRWDLSLSSLSPSASSTGPGEPI
ncbi:unnamed protein product [Lepidochelys olivacea]